MSIIETNSVNHLPQQKLSFNKKKYCLEKKAS